jgi:RNase P/RNase MRP subunit POP5
LKNAFSELKEVLLNIKEEPSVKNALKYFDFISWLESKIEKRSFAELVKEKMSN